MPQPTLFILCGLPYSGKTTLSHRMVERLRCELVSIDTMKASRGLSDVWEEMTAAQWQSIFEEARSTTRNALAARRDVVYDSANQDRASRDVLRALAREALADTVVVWIDAPPELVGARWSAAGERLGPRLPEWAMRAALQTYEPPTDEDDVIRLDGSASIDHWLAQLPVARRGSRDPQ